ncbi:Molybdopterin synthase/thiamin biosynthesis sulphur carrier, beta-grasp [Moorella glycerini]|uniref:Sulfur carrier protein ThiS n=1 Tax=Neomoorella stamsii TaxID=1266720 RepID=A0A9X7J0K4_9FIRM|nr:MULTISPECIES: sulfur carrier protein ThiS [Moorella]PRR68559.1 hypothetical protein MOST_33380 [Moorella stamsii]CEP66117.1 Molybdopterin synthase/thiamin biosynthesis sulphur carrier, beta-grasp [Moorella glycerini]
MIKVQVNGQEYEWEEGQTVHDLITFFKGTGEYDDRIGDLAFMVVVNDCVIPPEEYKKRLVYDGDNVRLLSRFFGG